MSNSHNKFTYEPGDLVDFSKVDLSQFESLDALLEHYVLTNAPESVKRRFLDDFDQQQLAILKAKDQTNLAYTEALHPRDKNGKWARVAYFLNAKPEDFHASIQYSKKDKYGAFLSDYDVAEYAKMNCILSKSGKTGAAVKIDGDIVSVFNRNGPGAGLEAIKDAISKGGNHLDCIGDGLRTHYEKIGFEVTETIPWDDEHAPEDWDYEQFGRPNIYVLYYKG